MSLFSKDRNVHRFTVAGKPVSCPLCGGTAFVASSAQLHTQGLTFFQLEWLGSAFHDADMPSLQKNRHHRFTHDNLPHTVLGFMEIKTTLYRPELDILHCCRTAE